MGGKKRVPKVRGIASPPPPPPHVQVDGDVGEARCEAAQPIQLASQVRAEVRHGRVVDVAQQVLHAHLRLGEGRGGRQACGSCQCITLPSPPLTHLLRLEGADRRRDMGEGARACSGAASRRRRSCGWHLHSHVGLRREALRVGAHVDDAQHGCAAVAARAEEPAGGGWGQGRRGVRRCAPPRCSLLRVAPHLSMSMSAGRILGPVE